MTDSVDRPRESIAELLETGGVCHRRLPRAFLDLGDGIVRTGATHKPVREVEGLPRALHDLFMNTMEAVLSLKIF
jgi:hypothetical protein